MFIQPNKMKISILIFFVLALTFGICSSDAENVSLRASIMGCVASNNVPEFIGLISGFGGLYTNNPRVYFENIRQTCSDLRPVTNDCSMVMLERLFQLMLNNRVPNDMSVATHCLNLERDAILGFFNFEPIRTNSECMIALAKYIGKIRCLRIPNYESVATGSPGRDILEKAGVMSPLNLKSPEQVSAYADAVQMNKNHLMQDRYQLALFESDKCLSFQLIHSCPKLSKNDSFVHEIETDAQLSAQEKSRLFKGF